MAERPARAQRLRSLLAWIAPGLVALIIAALALQPTRGDLNLSQNGPLERVQVLQAALFAYATDHDGAYPTGKSSTEVFQQLIDQKYVSDPSIFWFSLPGKTKATSTTLKPENVCWDVTVPVDVNSPDTLPVVFSTGYKVAYTANATAAPVFSLNENWPHGIAVSYHSQRAVFLKESNGTDRTVNGFTPGSFDAGGKPYQQLTPTGPLAP